MQFVSTATSIWGPPTSCCTVIHMFSTTSCCIVFTELLWTLVDYVVFVHCAMLMLCASASACAPRHAYAMRINLISSCWICYVIIYYVMSYYVILFYVKYTVQLYNLGCTTNLSRCAPAPLQSRFNINICDAHILDSHLWRCSATPSFMLAQSLR